VSRTEVAPPSPVCDDLRRLRPVLAALMTGLVLAELDATMLATALPTVVGELGGSDQLLWVTTAYLVTGTVMMPVLGRLGDLLGRRPVFLAALSVLVAGSVLGGLAVDLPTLVAARAVQGLGGGALVVLVYAVLADLLPARRRAPVMTAVGAVFAVCAIAGPLLGGWLAETVGWRWAFWVNVPVGVLAVLLAARTLPRGRPQRAPVHLDAPGIALLTVTVLALTLLVSVAARPGAPWEWLAAGAAATGGLALALVVVERRAEQPVLPPPLFHDRTFVVAVLAGLVLGAAMFATVGYLPTYLQMAAGLSPNGAGLMMLALVGGLGSAAVVAAQVVARTGWHRFLPVLGSVLTATALAVMSRWSTDTSLVTIGASLALLGVGIGCAWEVLVVVVQSTVPTRHVGIATATNGFFREVGVLVGSTMVGAAFTGRLQQGLLPLEQSTGMPVHSLTPERVGRLPSGVRAEVAAAYADALTPVFLVLVLPVAVGAALLLLVRRLHLATSFEETGEPGGHGESRGSRDFRDSRSSGKPQGIRTSGDRHDIHDGGDRHGIDDGGDHVLGSGDSGDHHGIHDGGDRHGIHDGGDRHGIHDSADSGHHHGIHTLQTEQRP